jgi:hypothetical protein
MFSSAAGLLGKALWRAARGFQFSFCIGSIQFLNWLLGRRPRIWLHTAQRRLTPPTRIDAAGFCRS